MSNSGKLAILTILLALVSLGFSMFALFKPKDHPRPPSGSTPLEVIKKSYQMPRWNGDDAFFAKNLHEVQSTTKVANMFEKSDVALALVEFCVTDKTYHETVWLRKDNGSWHWVPYLMVGMAGTHHEQWIKDNGEWLKDMEAKRGDWLAGSPSTW